MRTARVTLLLVAVAVVSAGGATAAQMITGADVRNGSLTGVDLKSGSVGPKVFSGTAQSELRGPAGKRGARGLRGPSNVFIHRRDRARINRADGVVTRQRLAAGRYALSTSFLFAARSGGTQTCALRIGTTQISAESLTTTAGERVALTIAGAVTIPSAGGDVRLVCKAAGRTGSASNISMMAIQVATAKVTNDS